MEYRLKAVVMECFPNKAKMDKYIKNNVVKIMSIEKHTGYVFIAAKTISFGHGKTKLNFN